MSKIFLLCVSLAWALQAAVTLTTTPAQVTFLYQIGATKLPAVQAVSVKVSTGTPTFTATTPGTDLWLTVDPSGGNVPTSLNVRVNPTSLPASTYSSTVTITVTGLPVAIIPVTLVVSPPTPILGVSAAVLTFTAPPLTPSSQTVTLSTSGAPISYSATAGAKWITINPAVGVVLPGAQNAFVVTVDPSTLAPQAAPLTDLGPAEPGNR